MSSSSHFRSVLIRSLLTLCTLSTKVHLCTSQLRSILVVLILYIYKCICYITLCSSQICSSNTGPLTSTKTSRIIYIEVSFSSLLVKSVEYRIFIYSKSCKIIESTSFIWILCIYYWTIYILTFCICYLLCRENHSQSTRYQIA
jgi:hypothetical protein